MRNKRSDTNKAFDQGYACALACLVSSHGSNTTIKEALASNGLTSIKRLRDSNVDSYDIDTLKDTIKELQGDRRRQRAAHPRGVSLRGVKG
jgi:hypothetical protein